MALNFFLKYVLAPLIFTLGLFGNILGLKVIGRKKLKNIGPILIYKLVFITDSIYLCKYKFSFIYKKVEIGVENNVPFIPEFHMKSV